MGCLWLFVKVTEWKALFGWQPGVGSDWFYVSYSISKINGENGRPHLKSNLTLSFFESTAVSWIIIIIPWPLASSTKGLNERRGCTHRVSTKDKNRLHTLSFYKRQDLYWKLLLSTTLSQHSYLRVRFGGVFSHGDTKIIHTRFQNCWNYKDLFQLNAYIFIYQ